MVKADPARRVQPATFAVNGRAFVGVCHRALHGALHTLGVSVLFLFALGAMASTPENAPQIVGEAFDLQSHELLYRELHCRQPRDQTQRVIYRNAMHDIIASKLLDYSTGRTTPSFVQRNLHTRESIAVELRSGKITTSITSDDSTGTENTVNTPVPTDSPLVIDAGFDHFVLDNWDALLAGDTKRFYFPLPGLESLVLLRVASSDCDYVSSSDQCFRLELDNWLLRIAVAPIELGYDAQRKRLQRYRGLSNIGNGEGQGLVVDIQYRYEHLPASRVCDLSATAT